MDGVTVKVPVRTLPDLLDVLGRVLARSGATTRASRASYYGIPLSDYTALELGERSATLDESYRVTLYLDELGSELFGPFDRVTPHMLPASE